MFSNNLGCKNIKQRAKSTLGAIFQINVPGGLAFAKPAFDMKGIHFMKKPGVETFHLWLYLNCPLIKESLSFCNIVTEFISIEVQTVQEPKTNWQASGLPPILPMPAARHYNPPTSSLSSSGRRASRSSWGSCSGTSFLTDCSWSQVLGSIVLV